MVERIYVFLGLFSLVYFFEAIGGSYIIAAIQNIEKQFQIPSRFSGFMISASDIGYIPSILFVSYLGSRGNRARWIGGGAILMALTYLMIASPNFIFPVAAPAANLSSIEDELQPLSSQLSPNATLSALLQYPLVRDRIPYSIREQLLNMEHSSHVGNVSLLVAPRVHENVSYYSIDGWLLEEICDDAEEVIEGAGPEKLIAALRQYIGNRPNNTRKDLFRIRRSANAPFSYCGKLVNNIRKITREVRCSEQGDNGGPFLIMFTALFLLGIGRTMPWSLGVPLLDDNVKRKNLPAYFGAISFIRILGPICGHLIGSVTNRFYYTLNPPAGLTASDPTWIGAWWIGFLIIGTITLFPSLVLFCFPSGKGKGDKISAVDDGKKHDAIEFFDKHKEKTKEGSLSQRAQEFGKSYKKVLSTKIYSGAVIGRILDILAFKGYIVFLPKYLENHFGIPLFKVHQYMAAFGVFGFALGTAVGGLLTRKLKFTGRQAALFVLCVSTINLAIFFSKAFIECESVVNSVGVNARDSNYNFSRACNADCGCDGAKLFPVCDATGFAFYSPCHAGCREVKVNHVNKQEIEFSSCECAEGGVVRKDNCHDNCRWPTVIFFTTVLVGAFFAGMGLVPGMLILLRSVPPATRSISLGLQGLLVSLFGTLPSPVLWGMVVDSACLVWEKSCDGSSGHCSIYDPHDLRMRMHIMYVGIRVISLVTDIYVWYQAKDLNIMDEEENTDDVGDELKKGAVLLEPIPSTPAD